MKVSEAIVYFSKFMEHIECRVGEQAFNDIIDTLNDALPLARLQEEAVNLLDDYDKAVSTVGSLASWKSKRRALLIKMKEVENE